MYNFFSENEHSRFLANPSDYIEKLKSREDPLPGTKLFVFGPLGVRKVCMQLGWTNEIKDKINSYLKGKHQLPIISCADAIFMYQRKHILQDFDDQSYADAIYDYMKQFSVKFH